MKQLLTDLNVIVCAGSGGVGKTTVSASLGILAAQQGRRVLVLTIDPARRLATALGLSDFQNQEEVRVPGQNYKGELFAAMIDSTQVFDDFIRRTSPDSQTTERLLNNRLYHQMATTLKGSQEFTSLEKLLQCYESNAYDLIILDTPPSGHAVDFLRAPEKIFALFQESITNWFVERPESKNVFRQLFNKGTKTVLGALERVTGSHFMTELGDFFRNMSGLQEEVSERSIRVHRLLAGRRTSFVLVTGFDEGKLQEARDFFKELRKGGYSLSSVIVNRSFPEWLPRVSDGRLRGRSDFQAVINYYNSLKSYYRSREKFYDEFQRDLGAQVQMVRVPELKNSIEGLEGLERLGDKIAEKFKDGESSQ